jgi:cytochrome c
MMKRSGLIFTGIFFSIILFSIVNFAAVSHEKQQDNQPPVVKINSPKNNDLFDWNTQVNYSISVADKEDGDSKFDEINVKEVLLEVRYADSKAKVEALLNKGVQADPTGLAVMRVSNCFNCHNFNSKSIGPSFYDINKRYPATQINTDSLVKRIRTGSTSIWGKEKMPSHAELTSEEIKSTVQWILKHAADPDVNYYIGTEGAFHTRPLVAGKKGAYILAASYTDHGPKTGTGKRIKGQDVVVIRSK